MPAAQKKSAPSANGNGQPDPLAIAIAYEQQIATEAAAIRAEFGDVLSLGLYMRLRPLLLMPIPAALIQTTEAVKGKPYESTGIRSLQVSIDRLDNVLTPFWWGYSYEHANDGRLCHLTSWLGEKDSPLFTRESWGGVNQGSTEGNVYKGSFTNTAKRGFAEAFGVGHEVYLGATDFDPDTDLAAAEIQAEGGKQPERKLSAEQAEKAAEAIEAAGLSDALPHKLRSFGVKALTDLTYEQGFALKTWIDEHSAKAGE